MVREPILASQYPLKNSSILDSGSSIHVFNQLARFLDFKQAPDGDFLWAGTQKIPIVGYGQVDVSLRGPSNRRYILRLENVAYVENFATNVISLRQLKRQGLWWNTRSDELKQGEVTIAKILDIHDQYVLEYLPGRSRLLPSIHDGPASTRIQSVTLIDIKLMRPTGTCVWATLALTPSTTLSTRQKASKS